MATRLMFRSFKHTHTHTKKHKVSSISRSTKDKGEEATYTLNVENFAVSTQKYFLEFCRLFDLYSFIISLHLCMTKKVLLKRIRSLLCKCTCSLLVFIFRRSGDVTHMYHTCKSVIVNWLLNVSESARLCKSLSMSLIFTIMGMEVLNA